MLGVATQDNNPGNLNPEQHYCPIVLCYAACIRILIFFSFILKLPGSDILWG